MLCHLLCYAANHIQYGNNIFCCCCCCCHFRITNGMTHNMVIPNRRRTPRSKAKMRSSQSKQSLLLPHWYGLSVVGSEKPIFFFYFITHFANLTALHNKLKHLQPVLLSPQSCPTIPKESMNESHKITQNISRPNFWKMILKYTCQSGNFIETIKSLKYRKYVSMLAVVVRMLNNLSGFWSCRSAMHNQHL